MRDRRHRTWRTRARLERSPIDNSRWCSSLVVVKGVAASVAFGSASARSQFPVCCKLPICNTISSNDAWAGVGWCFVLAASQVLHPTVTLLRPRGPKVGAWRMPSEGRALAVRSNNTSCHRYGFREFSARRLPPGEAEQCNHLDRAPVPSRCPWLEQHSPGAWGLRQAAGLCRSRIPRVPSVLSQRARPEP